MPEKRQGPEKKHGVTVTAWSGHPSYKWRVTFPDGGKRKSKGFKTKAGSGGALEFANDKRGLLKREGDRHGDVTDEERQAVITFRKLLAEMPESIQRPPLSEAVELFRKTLKVRDKSKTVQVLIDSYAESMKRKGVSNVHHYSTSKRLERFAEEYGDWFACDVSTEVVEDFLEDLNLAPLTVNHYRTSLVQLFNHALDKGAVESNPVVRVGRRKVRGGEIGIFTPSQVARLLEHAPEEILPGLALGFFAGVRRAELCRLDWSQIDFENEQLITINASTSKTAARRLIPLRENLRAWLLPSRKFAGSIMPSDQIWRTRLKDAMKSAKISEWPFNAPRHSFASYHLAKFQDAAALALEMGHGSTKMIFEHYRALVTPKDADRYWAIAPGEGESIAQFAG